MSALTPRVKEGYGRTGNMHLPIAREAWRWFRFEEGQDLLEYALLVALIAVVAVGAVTTVGTTLKTVFWDVIASSAKSI